MENTSGMGLQAQVPSEIQGWSWGAFFLNWIWGLFNNTFIALLCFVPCVGWVMPFVLGVKGNEWAWRNKKWESVESFKIAQRRWAWGGLGVFIFCIILIVSTIFFTFWIMKQSDAYKNSFSMIQKNSQVIEMLGTPIESGLLVSGNVNTSMGTGHAELSYSVSGPKGSAKVYLKAEKVLDHWEFQRLIVQPEAGEAVNLVTAP